jgi:hypothetical protein
MGRSVKKGLDFFPIDIVFDDSIELLQAECGIASLGILIKIWQKIYQNGYYVEWNDDVALLFSQHNRLEIEQINNVILVCLRRKIFNEDLYNNFGILTSSGIQKRFLKICKDSKRSNICVYSEFMLVSSEFIDIVTEFIAFIPDKLGRKYTKKGKELKKGKKGNTSEINPEEKPAVFSLENSVEDSFDDENLKLAFLDYAEMREKKKKPINTQGIFKRLINQLEKYDITTRLAMLDKSIINGWTDLYELNNNVRGKPKGGNFKQREYNKQDLEKLYLNKKGG